MWRLITFPFQPPMFHGVPLTRRTNIRGIPFFHLGSAIHFVVISTDANIASILALSVVLSCDSNYFSRSYENCTFITPMAGIRVTYLLTYSLTPWSRVLLEKLASLQLVKKFPAFYGTRRFLTALTSARHFSLS